MKFSLFPLETRSLELLLNLCREVQSSVQTLAELLGAPEADRDGLSAKLHASETRATDLHYALLTHLRTSFVNPLPREDLYTFSRLLHESVEQLGGVGELMLQAEPSRLSRRAAEQLEMLGRQADLVGDAIGGLRHLDDLEDTWLQLVRLAKRAERTHRAWIGEISELQKNSTVIKFRSLAEGLITAVRTLRQVADHLGRVLVKES